MFQAFSSDGHRVEWRRWTGDDDEAVTLNWENEGWTVEGSVRGADVQYVVRMSAGWQVQQVMLFRDLDQPDLWIATDGAGRWGEVNGAHRPDLDGCTEVWFDVTTTDGTTRLLSPFPAAIPIRRLGSMSALAPRQAAQVHAVTVDVETLGMVGRQMQYERLSEHRWLVRDVGRNERLAEFDVDDHGLPIDVDGHFRRVR
jgi:hypothetical protein